jgi:hypothetical protein
MPLVKYECSICKSLFSHEADAAACEARGLAEGLSPGSIFYYYLSNKEGMHVMVTGGEGRGHKWKYKYYFTKQPRVALADCELNMHAVRPEYCEDFWALLLQHHNSGVNRADCVGRH